MKWPRVHLFELHELNWFPNFVKWHVTFILHLIWTIDFPPYITKHYPLVHDVFKPRYISVSERISKTLKKLVNYYPNEEVVVMDMCSGASGPNDIISRSVNELLKDKIEKPVKFFMSDLFPNVGIWKAITANNPYLDYIEAPVDITKPFNFPQANRIFQTFYLCHHHFEDDQVRKIMKNSFDNVDGFAIVELTERSISSIVNTVFFSGIIFPLFIVPFFYKRLPTSIFFTIYIFPVLIFAMCWDGFVSSLRSRTNEELMEFVKEFDTEGWEIEFGSDRIHELESCHWLTAVRKPVDIDI